MDAGNPLEDTLSLAASFSWRARRYIEPEEYFDEDEVSLLLTKNGRVLLRERVNFVAPYIKAAMLTGEIRKDVDVQVGLDPVWWIPRKGAWAPPGLVDTQRRGFEAASNISGLTPSRWL